MTEFESDIGALFGVALEVPAGRESRAGEEGVGAGLLFGRIEEEFSLAVFLCNGIVGGDGDLREGLAVGGNAVAEDGVIENVYQQAEAEQRRCRDGGESLEEAEEAAALGWVHRGDYSRRRVAMICAESG